MGPGTLRGVATNDADGPTSSYSIRAVERVCDILDLLQGSDGASLIDVARVTGLPKSSAFRYLHTLERRRYVERDAAAGSFHLGLAFLPLHSRLLDTLTRAARPYLEALREEFAETVNLGMLDGTRIVYLEILESPKSMRLAARRGDRDPVHSTALGKAIASQLPEPRVLEILAAEGMPRQTERTIVRIDDYMKALARVREDGYAVDEGENEVGGRCVAVALGDLRMPVALSVSAPASRLALERVPDVAESLGRVAASLSRDLLGPPKDDADGSPAAAQASHVME